jgi:probable rRNA maturation factor
MSELVLRNHQQLRAVNLRLLRSIIVTMIEEQVGAEMQELGIHILSAEEMTRLNETFLRHAGPTDVLAFNYRPATERTMHHRWQLHGEIFVCMNEAVAQARRFRTSWQSEIVRYVIHGILHLIGYDDSNAAARRKMKRAEQALVRDLGNRFRFAGLARRK